MKEYLIYKADKLYCGEILFQNQNQNYSLIIFCFLKKQKFRNKV